MTLILRLSTTLDEVSGQADQWNALADRLGATAIFHDAAATLANLTVQMAKCRASPFVLTVFEGETMIAAAPMVWGQGWIGLGVLHWADSDTPLYSDLLCRPDREKDVFPLLAKGLLAQPGLRKLKVDYVPDDSALARFCAFLGAEPGCPVPTPHIDLSMGPVLDRLSPRRRKDLRNYRRKLEAMGPVTFEQHRTPEDLAELVAWIFRFKRSKLADHDGANWIQRPQTEHYFRDLAMRLAAQGRALGHRLRVGDQTAAASLTFRRGDTAFYSKIAYDPCFAAGSPGWHELLALSECLRADGVHLFDLMIGTGFVKEKIASGANVMRSWRLKVNPLTAFLPRTGSRAYRRSAPAP
ncbi:acetyltransferase (GNAT) family protein [Cereibacter ovatus]|uniref:Acetyltransferase (GNAT) family protein n=1 Tax=Cereibacter ovatus TaxID=439529 RepID=A0A285D483_9RHOB|nr:acetyltransferase (GNAT) family protein [Cereibacter ovatus]